MRIASFKLKKLINHQYIRKINNPNKNINTIYIDDLKVILLGDLLNCTLYGGSK
jgi:hypothetical protein